MNQNKHFNLFKKVENPMVALRRKKLKILQKQVGIFFEDHA